MNQQDESSQLPRARHEKPRRPFRSQRSRKSRPTRSPARGQVARPPVLSTSPKQAACVEELLKLDMLQDLEALGQADKEQAVGEALNYQDLEKKDFGELKAYFEEWVADEETGRRTDAATDEAGTLRRVRPQSPRAPSESTETSRRTDAADDEAAGTLRLARPQSLRAPSGSTRGHLLADILRKAAAEHRPLIAEGLVDAERADYGFLVFPSHNYGVLAHSPILPGSFLKRHALVSGLEISVRLHPPPDGFLHPFAMALAGDSQQRLKKLACVVPFLEQVPYYPTERIVLERKAGELSKADNDALRAIDLISPIGLGQRGLIVASPRVGKTVLLQAVAKSLCLSHPQARLIILLVDERPEEVTDFKRNVPKATIIASTFDEPAEHHIHASEMVIKQARRLAESGQHAIILLDSITRLARAWNTLAPSSGKILSGGIEAGALRYPKQFFGSARNIEGGGSLTILATALVETGSKMDEVVFEEFKGTGNMELHLDRELANKRIYPALSFDKSGTRKEELLYHGDEMQKIHSLRRAMKGIPSMEAMDMLISRISKSHTNAEFLMRLNH